jgi:hypothetical protein
MKGKSKAVLVVAALLLAMLLAYAWMNGMLGGGGGVVEGRGGAATLSFTVQFKDGTTQTFETTNIYTGKLCVVPLSLYVGGKEIAGINVTLKVKLATGGRTVNSYSAQIAQRMEIYKSGQSTPITSSTGNYNPAGDGWIDGDTKTVLSTPLTSAMIEQAIAQYSGSGDYYFQVAVQISLTVNTNDGVYTLTGSGVGGIAITFQQYQAMSMSVMVSVTPLTLVTP